MKKWETMKGAKKIPRVSKTTGYEYTFSEGPIAFPDPLDKPARTMLTSEGGANRSTHIILDPLTGRKRKLTPLECERINGFRDGWTDTGIRDGRTPAVFHHGQCAGGAAHREDGGAAAGDPMI